jgi:DNA-directed RNA polymerase subunit M/transcription elongation factor TFIIS
MSFGPEYNNRSTFGESLDRMIDEPDTKVECEHQMKFDHSAHYGRWDLFKCTKCEHQELIYWEQ